MMKIKLANETNAALLALLGRITYVESHGHFIEDKNDLSTYITQAFSVGKTKKDLNNSNNLFYIIYVDELPVGYAKLALNAKHESITSLNNCQLERIYILNDFTSLKIGQALLNFVEEKAKELAFDTVWLTTYIKNDRAIRFYEKNKFINVGKIGFLVNGTNYENIVYSKKI